MSYCLCVCVCVCHYVCYLCTVAQMGHFNTVLLLFLPVPMYLLFTSFTRAPAELRGLLKNKHISAARVITNLYLVVLPSASSITTGVRSGIRASNLSDSDSQARIKLFTKRHGTSALSVMYGGVDWQYLEVKSRVNCLLL